MSHKVKKRVLQLKHVFESMQIMYDILYVIRLITSVHSLNFLF